MRKLVFALFVVMTMLVANMAFSAEKEKVIKAVIELTAGNKGDITFPHEEHRKVIKDCMTCHTLFPQKTGAISSQMAAGKLQKKQVMNHCLACHRSMKAENKKTGPTSCAQCHKKK